MGQQFYLSLYDQQENKYLNRHFFLSKLGEIASNEYWYWGYIKNRPLRIGFIGSQSDRYCKKADGDEYDYGVASDEMIFESDCAGALEFDGKLPQFEWSGYLANHTQGLFINVSDYYECSKIGKFCLDPLVILAASNRCASLFWDGFTDGSAYSLLSNWFADVVEWVECRPADMSELAELEFCELRLRSMCDAWDATPEGYLADRNGKTLFTREDLGLLGTKISPAKCNYKVVKIDNERFKLSQEFVPDEGVVLAEEGDGVSFNTPDGDKFDNFKKEWFGTARIKNIDGSCLSYFEWATKELQKQEEDVR
jgi:hypothetical protein